MRIIALDPGKRNFAAAVMEDRKVLETRYLLPITSLKGDDFDSNAKVFRDDYFTFLCKYEPDYVVAERFMARPGGKQGSGGVGEYVNIMLGIVGTVNAAKDIPTRLITPAQWKNSLNSRYGKVEDMKHWFPHLSVHEADALGMAIYSFEKELPEEKGKLLTYVKRLRKYPFVGKCPKVVRPTGA